MPHGYLILLHTVQCLKHHAQLLAHIRNERINDRMNDEQKKLNWTVHAYKYKPYAVGIYAMQESPVL